MAELVEPGEVLAGKYRIDRVVGSGGMGLVVAATHLQLEETVAIKFLHPEALGNSEAIARFAREARAAVKIKSEHVGRVIDVGTREDGCPYMVMEYLEGGDLAGILQQEGPLAVDHAVEFILQACDAIAHAHLLGIVHRDLKPANLFLTRRPDGTPLVKVLDFGISKVTALPGSSHQASMTRTSAVMGSPLYMSPEQMASARDVDGRTDIWALGAILYELLAGEPPFNAPTMPQLCAMILSGKHERLRHWRPTAPAGIEAIVDRCLEKDPSRRYPNVYELAKALADFAPKRALVLVDSIGNLLQSGNLSTSGVVLGEPLSLTPGGRTAIGWAGSVPPANRKSAVVLLLIGVAATIGIGAAALTWRSRASGPRDTGEPSPRPAALAPERASPLPIAEPIATAPEPPAAESAAPAPTESAAPGPSVAAPPTRPGRTSRPRPASPASKTASPTVDPPAPAAPVDLFGDRK